MALGAENSGEELWFQLFFVLLWGPKSLQGLGLMRLAGRRGLATVIFEAGKPHGLLTYE